MLGISHETLARRLRNAYGSGGIPPLRDGLDPQDIVNAYAIQDLNTRFWEAEGRKIIGRKIGLTAKAVQAQLGVGQPDFGVLFDDMRIGNNGTLSPARVIQPKAEAEVALVLSKDVTKTDPTPEDIADASAYAVAALEIVDSRIADWKISFADTVADNGSSAFFVLGDEQEPLDGLDLYTCGMVMEINHEIVSIGSGAACLGHPLIAAAWLAKTLVKVGHPLRAGDIVLTGALGPMVTLAPGDHVVARIGGLGSVSFTYGEE
ncbi:2-keto-4-pentenoate hydratase [Henriciella mobilis]|uniref:2-keto-4-pentenoate hydratase n=1 Tax=Henriciella mobilis TaxID=2305467 RepID=UPI000E66D77E|nr:2-keto-4-pentenoate hydratase [Henriciella mobilis]RIJ20149.1 2-keto-4-pentenoate hydratase [Henriciella mobilis]